MHTDWNVDNCYFLLAGECVLALRIQILTLETTAEFALIFIKIFV